MSDREREALREREYDEGSPNLSKRNRVDDDATMSFTNASDRRKEKAPQPPTPLAGTSSSIHATPPASARTPRPAKVRRVEGYDGEGFQLVERGPSLAPPALSEPARAPREFWDCVQVSGATSVEWDPVKFPMPGQAPSDPGESTIRYSTVRRPTDGFLTALRAQLVKLATKGFPRLDTQPSFRCEGEIQYPDAKLVTRDGRQVKDITFATMEQAASVGQLKELVVVDGDLVVLRKVKMGVCHSRSLISIRATPEVERGARQDTVPGAAYEGVISTLLAQPALRELACVGAWREAIEWPDNSKTLRPVLLFVLKRKPGSSIHLLPNVVYTKSEATLDDTKSTQRLPVYYVCIMIVLHYLIPRSEPRALACVKTAISEKSPQCL